VAERFPKALVQLEDFATDNAFHLLEKYRNRYCTFDDDIQGTGSVALAGILAALRVIGGRLADRKYLFLGSGEAGVGIARALMAAMMDYGLSEAAARSRCWFFDSKGLVVAGREKLAAHKQPFAHDHPFTADFLEAVRSLRPAAIIGVSGVPGTFTRPVLEAMAEVNERPLIFALSNPTSKSECTASEAYAWTDGRAIFASGSPFDSVVIGGRTLVPGQANNAYIFPGVGLGAIASETTRITDEMFYVAARALAEEVTADDLAMGRIFPSLTRIREVSLKIAVAVADVAYRRGLTPSPRPENLAEHVRSKMFEPAY
jgi:malate dehydrogenase (oxaloacetate-decarboxylating)(NADP+)